MTKFRIVGAAAILAFALASPAMAQEVIINPGKCAQYYPNANCQNYGPGNPYTGGYQQHAYRHNGTWNDSYNRWDGDRWSDRNNGVRPGGCTPGTYFRGEDGRRHLCR